MSHIQINQTILAVFDRFITENAERLEDLFYQMDKDKSGNITLEEFKYGLKDFGLRLTNVSRGEILNRVGHYKCRETQSMHSLLNQTDSL